MNYRKEIEETNRNIRKLHMKCTYGRLRDSGLYPDQFPVLHCIEQNPGCSQSDIAKMRGCSCAAVGVSVRRLENAGFVARCIDEKDLRTNRLELTEAGRRVVAETRRVLDEVVEESLQGFSQDDLADYCGYLRRVQKNLENALDQGGEEQG